MIGSPSVRLSETIRVHSVEGLGVFAHDSRTLVDVEQFPRSRSNQGSPFAAHFAPMAINRCEPGRRTIFGSKSERGPRVVALIPKVRTGKLFMVDDYVGAACSRGVTRTLRTVIGI